MCLFDADPLWLCRLLVEVGPYQDLYLGSSASYRKHQCNSQQLPCLFQRLRSVHVYSFHSRLVSADVPRWMSVTNLSRISFVAHEVEVISHSITHVSIQIEAEAWNDAM
jgi:hypothetical protein